MERQRTTRQTDRWFTRLLDAVTGANRATPTILALVKQAQERGGTTTTADIERALLSGPSDLRIIEGFGVPRGVEKLQREGVILPGRRLRLAEHAALAAKNTINPAE